MKFFLGQNFDFSYRRQLVSRVFFVVGVILCVVYFLLTFTRQNNFSPARIYLVDNSLSMAAKDISGEKGKISRFDLAKKILEKDTFVGKKGIITFARVPNLQLPMTDDTILFQNTAKNLQIISSAGGSDIKEAIEQINTLYEEKEVQIVVMTDGETFEDFVPPKWISEKISWSIFGIGTIKGAFIVEWYQSDGTPYYKRFQGKKVTSQLDEKNLKNLAHSLRADYVSFDSVKNLTSRLEKLPLQSKKQTFVFRDLLVFLGIFSIIVSYFVLPYKYHKYA